MPEACCRLHSFYQRHSKWAARSACTVATHSCDFACNLVACNCTCCLSVLDQETKHTAHQPPKARALACHAAATPTSKARITLAILWGRCIIRCPLTQWTLPLERHTLLLAFCTRPVGAAASFTSLARLLAVTPAPAANRAQLTGTILVAVPWMQQRPTTSCTSWGHESALPRHLALFCRASKQLVLLFKRQNWGVQL